jgi:hypothetical protein
LIGVVDGHQSGANQRGSLAKVTVAAQRELAAHLKSLKNRPIRQNYSTLVGSPLRITVSEGQPEYKLELKR